MVACTLNLRAQEAQTSFEFEARQSYVVPIFKKRCECLEGWLSGSELILFFQRS